MLYDLVIVGLRYVFNVCLCRFGKWADEALFGLFGQAITAVGSVRLQFAREQLSTLKLFQNRLTVPDPPRDRLR